MNFVMISLQIISYENNDQIASKTGSKKANTDLEKG